MANATGRAYLINSRQVNKPGGFADAGLGYTNIIKEKNTRKKEFSFFLMWIFLALFSTF